MNSTVQLSSSNTSVSSSFSNPTIQIRSRGHPTVCVCIDHDRLPVLFVPHRSGMASRSVVIIGLRQLTAAISAVTDRSGGFDCRRNLRLRLDRSLNDTVTVWFKPQPLRERRFRPSHKGHRPSVSRYTGSASRREGYFDSAIANVSVLITPNNVPTVNATARSDNPNGANRSVSGKKNPERPYRTIAIAIT